MVPLATYLAVGIITTIFALATLAIVSALGRASWSTGRGAVHGGRRTPLVDSAQVIFSVADEYVGDWLSTLMSWLVLSSLFAGLLAFQNSAARYIFSMGRAGVLPSKLARLTGRRPGSARSCPA